MVHGLMCSQMGLRPGGRGLGHRLHGSNWKELLRGELSGWEMDGVGYQDAKEPLMLVSAGQAPALRVRASDHITMRERQGQWESRAGWFRSCLPSISFLPGAGRARNVLRQLLDSPGPPDCLVAINSDGIAYTCERGTFKNQL